MPRVTIYPAFSADRDAPIHRMIFDAPEKTTAHAIKRAAGHDASSWLYVRLPRHKADERCDCYSCEHDKAGWWKRPSWSSAPKGETYPPGLWRWIRYNIEARNVRLNIKGGEHFVVVAVIDMPLFAASLASRGRHGLLMSLPWALTKRAA